LIRKNCVIVFISSEISEKLGRSFDFSPKMQLILVIIFTVVVLVSSYCPNGCNGHGSCGVNDSKPIGKRRSKVR